MSAGTAGPSPRSARPARERERLQSRERRQPGRGPAEPRPGEERARRRPGGRAPQAAAAPARLRLGNPQRRINAGLIAMSIVLSLFAGRLVQLQGLDSKIYEARAAQQRVQPETLPAKRGAITDRNGHALAVTVEAREIFVDPFIVEPAERDGVATTLAQELGLPKEEIAAKLAQADKRYLVVARGVEPPVARRIAAHGLKGVGVKTHYQRTYPGGELAGGLIGFVGDEGRGLAGAELTYDKVLAGREGRQTVEIGLDGQRIPMTRSTRQEPVPGRDVRLTIDRDLQWAAQRAITEQVRRTQARSGSVIVLDVRTGQVLAMANAPELDLNKWRKAPPEQLGNRAVSEIFEPGSTNKVITAAAALESGALRPDSVFQVKDHIQCADRTIRDSHAHPPEQMTFTESLARSSNVATIMAAEKVGDKRLYDTLRAFGFGAKTGGGFFGEEAGLLPEWRSWSGSQRCTVAFGQGLSVTALQLASVYQTIANGGVRITPTLVAGTTDEQGRLVAAEPPKRTRVISERTARELARMLEAAVSQEGTGKLATIDGYRVAGKTGTAQRYDQDCQGYCGYTASFVGFTPASEPRLVALAVIQAPENGYYGGEIAAPVFKDVMTFALKTMKIPPNGADPASARIRTDE